MEQKTMKHGTKRSTSLLEKRQVRLSAFARLLACAALLLLAPMAAEAQITEIIDPTGDGAGNPLDAPPRTSGGTVVDGSGNVYVTGSLSHNAFKITPGGTITEIIDSSGDGTNPLDLATGIAVDGSGNVYVAGRESDNVFKISTPGSCSTGGTPCTITEIINSSGDGSDPFDGPLGLAVDGSGNVYATGSNTDNAFKISTPGSCSTGGTPCTITRVIDSTGDGAGNTLDNPRNIAVDGSGNVYVPGWLSDNAFKIAMPGGTVTEMIDAAGDGAGNLLDKPVEITVDASGNVYLTAEGTSAIGNAFKIAAPGSCSTGGTPCTITEIIDSTGDGSGNSLSAAEGIAVDGSGNVYLTGFISDNAFKIDTPGSCSTGGTPCTITEIIDLSGDGTHSLDGPQAIAVDGSGNLYVSAFFTDNAFKISPAGPNLSIATDIPAAELETVDVDVDFAGNGESIAATTFSVDYDQTCLSFDDTDANADNIPDALAFSVPAGFAVTAFHDLGDSDGEIDVSVTDLSPPIATLPDGALLTITFTATCSPALGATITAPAVFSSDPSATFSDDLAVDVTGTTTDGSVEIWPGPRGDCNGNGAVSAADLIGGALEIFDADGTFWADAPGSTFVGSPVGCDANANTVINAGDISCIILRIFGGTCAGLPFAEPAEDKALSALNAPLLSLEGARRAEDGALWIPVVFSAGSHAVSSVAFSLDLADRGLVFDPFDGDGDGVPDAVRFPAARPDLIDVRYNAADSDGELDLTLATFGGVLADGLLLEVAVRPLWRHDLSVVARYPARFSEQPAASFGNPYGQDVEGYAVKAARP